MLWLKFSRRYMFSPKSHSVINIIAMVSMVAVAIPTAAMIILLAMFGGLSRTIETIYSAVDADIEII
ncbi:MAG: ABC transporter permease, partial [Alistipes sp.]|nr:ABC transporter permease [Alistipes sp.]